MSRFGDTQSAVMEQKIRRKHTNPVLARVLEVYTRGSTDENTNTVIDATIYGGETVNTVPFIAPSSGEVNVPSVGDTVMIEWRSGDNTVPMARQAVHTNNTRSPKAQAGMWRKKAGRGSSVYIESNTSYDGGDAATSNPDTLDAEKGYARLAAKDDSAAASNSDSTGLRAAVEVFEDAQNGNARSNIVSGTISWDSATKSNSFNTNGSAYYIADTSGGGVTGTISADDEVHGRQMEFERSGSGTLTVDTESDSTIEGGSSITVDSDGMSAILIYDGGNDNWRKRNLGGDIETSDTVKIGDDNAGIIVHRSTGTTKDGVSVDVSDWIEVYGKEVHFSNTS